jgi:hypothetical protein
VPVSVGEVAEDIEMGNIAQQQYRAGSMQKSGQKGDQKDDQNNFDRNINNNGNNNNNNNNVDVTHNDNRPNNDIIDSNINLLSTSNRLTTQSSINLNKKNNENFSENKEVQIEKLILQSPFFLFEKINCDILTLITELFISFSSTLIKNIDAIYTQIQVPPKTPQIGSGVVMWGDIHANGKIDETNNKNNKMMSKKTTISITTSPISTLSASTDLHTMLLSYLLTVQTLIVGNNILKQNFLNLISNFHLHTLIIGVIQKIQLFSTIFIDSTRDFRLNSILFHQINYGVINRVNYPLFERVGIDYDEKNNTNDLNHTFPKKNFFTKFFSFFSTTVSNKHSFFSLSRFSPQLLFLQNISNLPLNTRYSSHNMTKLAPLHAYTYDKTTNGHVYQFESFDGDGNEINHDNFGPKKLKIKYPDQTIQLRLPRNHEKHLLSTPGLDNPTNQAIVDDIFAILFDLLVEDAFHVIYTPFYTNHIDNSGETPYNRPTVVVNEHVLEKGGVIGGKKRQNEQIEQIEQIDTKNALFIPLYSISTSSSMHHQTTQLVPVLTPYLSNTSLLQTNLVNNDGMFIHPSVNAVEATNSFEFYQKNKKFVPNLDQNFDLKNYQNGNNNDGVLTKQMAARTMYTQYIIDHLVTVQNEDNNNDENNIKKNALNKKNKQNLDASKHDVLYLTSSSGLNLDVYQNKYDKSSTTNSTKNHTKGSIDDNITSQNPLSSPPAQKKPTPSSLSTPPQRNSLYTFTPLLNVYNKNNSQFFKEDYLSGDSIFAISQLFGLPSHNMITPTVTPSAYTYIHLVTPGLNGVVVGNGEKND